MGNLIEARRKEDERKSRRFAMNVKIIRSNRKTLAIQINPDLSVTVRAPMYAPQSDIERILREKEGWIQKHIEKIREQGVAIVYFLRHVEPLLGEGQRAVPVHEKIAALLQKPHGAADARL